MAVSKGLVIGAAGLLALVVVAAGLSFSGLLSPTQTAKTGPDLNSPAPVKIAELIGKTYPLAQAVDSLGSPKAGAPSVVRIRQGAQVEVVGLVDGNAWLQIQLPDKRLAYVPVEAIPAAAPGYAIGAAPPPPPSSTPAATQAIAGAAGNGSPQASGMPLAAPVRSQIPADNAEAPPADADNAAPIPGMVQFQSVDDKLMAVKDTGIFLAPNPAAPQAYIVKAGTPVHVVAESKDGNWAWVVTADNSPAYIMMTDLGSPAP